MHLSHHLLPIPHHRRSIGSHQREGRGPNILFRQLTLPSLTFLFPCLRTRRCQEALHEKLDKEIEVGGVHGGTPGDQVAHNTAGRVALKGVGGGRDTDPDEHLGDLHEGDENGAEGVGEGREEEGGGR